MIIPQLKDIRHKNQMYRLLREILGNSLLVNYLRFKGGTYAALRGVLDRFSIDLDFDLPDSKKKDELRNECYKVFKKLSLEIKDESKNYLQFFLKYKSKPRQRNTLKLEINDDINKANEYEKVHLLEINMYCTGQTLDTMFANKLVACKNRFERTGKVAGRDFYDIHHFFLEGLSINEKVIKEVTGLKTAEYLKSMITFIEEYLTKTVINQDLSPLLSKENLKIATKNLKPELLSILKGLD